MKKNFFLMALAAMSLASCSNDEVVEIKQNMISFDVASDNASRAETLYDNNNKPETFIVYAVHTDVDGNKKIYIDGKGVTLSGGKYVFSDGRDRYWPETGTLTFYAVVPPTHYINDEKEFDQSVVETNHAYFRFDRLNEFATNLESPRITFLQTFLDEDVENGNSSSEMHHDLIYAVKANQSKPAVSGTKVVLNFRHALSQIVFKAQNLKPEVMYVEIDHIWIQSDDMWSFADFTLPNLSTDENVTEANGKQLLNQGTWTGLGEDDFASSFGGYYYIENLNVSLSDNSIVDICDSNDEKLLLIPGTYDKWNGKDDDEDNGGMRFWISCKIYNISDPEKGYQEGIDALISDGETIPLDVEWKQGKKYIYTLKFGGEDPISFDLTVDDYISGTDTPVTVY